MRRVWRPRRGAERRQQAAGVEDYLAIVDPGTSRLRFLVVETTGEKATVWGWDDVPGRPDADAHQLHLACEEMLARTEAMARERSERWLEVDQMLVGLPASQLLGRASTFLQRRAAPEQPVDMAELETLLRRGLRLALNRLQSSIPREPGAGGAQGSSHHDTSSEWLLVDATIVALTVDGRRVTDPAGFRGEELGVTIFVALAHAETIETWRTVAMALGFSTLTLTAAPLAVVMGLAEPQGVLVDVGGETTDLTLWQAARPVALASLPTGGDALTRALVRTWGLTLDMAERLKQTYARGFLEEDEARQVQEVMFPVLRTWWEETEIRLAQLNMDEGLPQWLYLLGGGSALPDMVEAASALAWSERLHFERYPQVGRIQPHDVPGVVNRTNLGRGAGDVPALALAAWTAIQNQPCSRPAGILRDLCQGQCTG